MTREKGKVGPSTKEKQGKGKRGRGEKGKVGPTTEEKQGKGKGA